MEFLSIDVGGSGIKYAILDDNFNIISSDKYIVTTQTYHEFIYAIKEIYDQNKKPDGGIAISYCGELDEQTGFIHNGGSYLYNTGKNLKESLENICHTKVSIENDGNCAALAELHRGSLLNFKDCAVVVIGTGLGGAIILDRQIRHGINKFAGSLSFMSSDIGERYNLDNIIAKKTSYRFLLSEYNRKVNTNIRTGSEFFELVNNKDEVSLSVLSQYCQNIANVLLNIHLLLDIEIIAVGGGISAQPIFKDLLLEEFDKIFTTSPIDKLNMKKPYIVTCRYHNNSNLYGALCYHMNL